jgi:EAL domain-containing protein (putative c-di-GMP-specific phosphodiesterase class I)/GGDEF domain-containing protein
MTLHRRLTFAVIALILFLLTANMVITLYNARLNVYQQLKVHSQDTATSLGFSLSQAALDKDNVHMSLMVDAIFDRGYYRRIVFRDLEGEEVINRVLPLSSTEVPSWFIYWLPLPEPTGSAQVSSGWYQLGEIEVVSHPGFAYQDMWRSFKEQLWLFLVTTVLCYLLLGASLKFVLRPLCQVEKQADAICRREFPIQEVLPSIPELRNVVLAMNRMVDKVKGMFQYHIELNDHLHHQLNTDPVTGLSNRQHFDQCFKAALTIERAAACGALMLIRAGDLQAMNVKQGRQQGDDYLCCIAESLQETLDENVSEGTHYLLSRHSGADFALFVPAINECESKDLMNKIYGSLQELEWQLDEMQAIFIGALYMPTLSTGTTGTNFMALADGALSQAQNEQVSGCYWHKVGKSEVSISANEWSTMIQTAIRQKDFFFYFQPVWEVIHGERRLLFNEIMIRMRVGEKEYAAGAFMPMATRFHLLPQIDALVIEGILSGLQVLPENICINCSIAAIQDDGFMTRLKSMLEDNPLLAPRLTFELPANGLSFSGSAIRDFALMIKKYGAKLSLHHFGRGSSEFAYLQTLPVDCLKIDRHFIQRVVTDADTRFFVRSLVAIANSCDIKILAEGVETEQQWQALMDLGIQGGQGYWLGKPSLEHIIG